MNRSESFHTASAYCDKFRAQHPPHYNHRRQYDRPIPSLNPVSPAVSDYEDNDQENSDEDGIDESRSAQDAGENSSQGSEENAKDEQTQNNESVFSDDGIDGNRSAQDSDEHSNADDEQTQNNQSVFSEDGIDVNRSAHDAGGNLSQRSEENAIVEQNRSDENESTIGNGNETSDDQNNAAGSNEKDIKYSLRTVRMDLGDETAINSLFNNGSNDESAQLNENHDLNDLVLSNHETAERQGDQIIITKVFDNDLQMIYIYGEKPMPRQPLYQVKLNDPISENIPFKENVSIIHNLNSQSKCKLI